LADLISRFLKGEYDYPEFQHNFRPALESYERSIDDRAYSPLDAVADIPEHCKSDLRAFCEQALDRLPKEALDRSTRRWIESTLIAEEDGYTYYSFFDGSGRSRFGNHATIYSTRVDQESFLLSSFNGTVCRPSFQYSKLLAALRAVGSDELATWVYGTEPDGAFASIDHVWSLGDSYCESYHLRRIERHPSPEGGGSYLMLLPKSKEWMLMNEYDGERFTIALHGSRRFIEDVVSRIDATPDWG